MSIQRTSAGVRELGKCKHATFINCTSMDKKNELLFIVPFNIVDPSHFSHVKLANNIFNIK